MKAILPIFAWLMLVGGLERAVAQLPRNPAGAPAARQRPAAAAESVAGDGLLRRSLGVIDAQPSISAKVRQKVDIDGIVLVGGGAYRQQGRGVGRLLRFELEVQAGAGEPSVLKQICDGRNLWIYEGQGDSKSVTRVELARIAGARPKSPATKQPALPLGLGGLAKLLEQLIAEFDFGKVSESRLGEVRVWTVEGTWKPARLIELMPSQKEAVEKKQPLDYSSLSPQIPSRVVVHIGCDDFFPYRFEFWRDQPANKSAADKERMLTVIELFEVQLGVAIDMAQFAFDPGSLPVADGTPALLEKLGLEAALPAGATQSPPPRR